MWLDSEIHLSIKKPRKLPRNLIEFKWKKNTLDIKIILKHFCLQVSGHLLDLNSQILVFYYYSSYHLCFQVSIRKIHANAVIEAVYILNEAAWGYLLIGLLYPQQQVHSPAFLKPFLPVVQGIQIHWGSWTQNLISFLKILWIHIELQNQTSWLPHALSLLFPGVDGQVLPFKCWWSLL